MLLRTSLLTHLELDFVPLCRDLDLLLPAFRVAGLLHVTRLGTQAVSLYLELLDSVAFCVLNKAKRESILRRLAIGLRQDQSEQTFLFEKLDGLFSDCESIFGMIRDQVECDSRVVLAAIVGLKVGINLLKSRA